MQRELRDYEALLEEFEVDVSYSMNATCSLAKDEAKTYVVSRLGITAAAGALGKLTAKAKQLRAVQKAIAASIGVVGRLGKLYQVEGRGPARIVDVAVEGWARVPLGTPVGGVYIVKNKATGKLLKVRKSDEWLSRFREYWGWHLNEGLQIEIEFFAVEAKTVGHRRTVEDQLRNFLRSEGHDLPRDFEARK